MRRGLLWVGYGFLVSLLLLVTLEAAARWVGFGTPVLYYNAAWGGIRPLPGQQVKRLKGATITIDQNGFRSARSQEPEALRVLFLGDSVTWGGSQVDDAVLFSEVAADVLRVQGQPVYAMNAGVNATALVNHTEIFWREIESTDVVVWLFPWGDVFRAYFAGGSLWPARFQPQFALVELIDNVLLHYWTNLFRKRGESVRAAFSPIGTPVGYQSFFESELEERKKKNLKAFRSVLAETVRRDMPVIIGVTPNLDEGQLTPLEEEAKGVLQDVAGSGVYVLDVSAILRHSDDPLPSLFIDSVHLTASGHRVVGAALGQILVQAVHEKLRRAPLGHPNPELRERTDAVSPT